MNYSGDITRCVVVSCQVTELVESDVYHCGSLTAGALLGSLPVAFVCSFFVEHYVSGS